MYAHCLIASSRSNRITLILGGPCRLFTIKQKIPRLGKVRISPYWTKISNNNEGQRACAHPSPAFYLFPLLKVYRARGFILDKIKSILINLWKFIYLGEKKILTVVRLEPSTFDLSFFRTIHYTDLHFNYTCNFNITIAFSRCGLSV